jgi:hypothetical protein
VGPWPSIWQTYAHADPQQTPDKQEKTFAWLYLAGQKCFDDKPLYVFAALGTWKGAVAKWGEQHFADAVKAVENSNSDRWPEFCQIMRPEFEKYLTALRSRQ